MQVSVVDHSQQVHSVSVSEDWNPIGQVQGRKVTFKIRLEIPMSLQGPTA